MLICSAMLVFFAHEESWKAATVISFVTGMWVQDWVYRMRDKYETQLLREQLDAELAWRRDNSND